MGCYASEPIESAIYSLNIYETTKHLRGKSYTRSSIDLKNRGKERVIHHFFSYFWGVILRRNILLTDVMGILLFLFRF